jgi:hypothetical protein
MKRIFAFPKNDFFILTGTMVDLMCSEDYDTTSRIFQRLIWMQPPPDYCKILADIYSEMPPECKEKMSHLDFVLMLGTMNIKLSN